MLGVSDEAGLIGTAKDVIDSTGFRINFPAHSFLKPGHDFTKIVSGIATPNEMVVIVHQDKKINFKFEFFLSRIEVFRKDFPTFINGEIEPVFVIGSGHNVIGMFVSINEWFSRHTQGGCEKGA